MSLWVTIPLGAYKVGKELGLWEKFLTAFQKKRRILVLGASGAGKSEFVNSLFPTYPKGSRGHRRTNYVHERGATLEKTPFVLIDTPGQQLDEAKRKKAIGKAIRDTVTGIINVVCCGYHEAEEAGSIGATPKSRTGSIANKSYLKVRKKVELDQLAEWVPRLEVGTAKWILTVVTKADLWWPDDTSEVRATYETGVYADALDGFSQDHYVLPYCSVIEPFYGTRTSGVFGDHHRGALRENLLNTILHLSGVEAK